MPTSETPSINPLTPRQQLFVEEYLVDLNATQAAIRAGYAPGSARQTAHQLMTKHDIQQAILKGRDAIGRRIALSIDSVIAELGTIGFSRISDYFVPDQAGNPVFDESALLDPRRSAAISQIDIEDSPDGKRKMRIKFADKRAALVDIGKHLGAFDRPNEAQRPDLVEPPNSIEAAKAILAILRQAEVDQANRRLTSASSN